MIRPLYDKIAVRLIDADSKTESGIVIPGNNDHVNPTGVVVATGEGHILASGELRPLTVQVGDTVLLPYKGKEIKVEGDTISMFAEQEIIGILS